jgi:hypothetical protein
MSLRAEGQPASMKASRQSTSARLRSSDSGILVWPTNGS